MDELSAYREELLAKLMDSANKIAHLGSGVPARLWHVKPDLQDVTPHYTLAHLREVEIQVFGRQLHRIVDEDDPLLPFFNESAWMARHYNVKEQASVILADLANLRKFELKWLRALPVSSWSRPARHPTYGERTLQWWVELQLEYSTRTLNQLTASLNV